MLLMKLSFVGSKILWAILYKHSKDDIQMNVLASH